MSGRHEVLMSFTLAVHHVVTAKLIWRRLAANIKRAHHFIYGHKIFDSARRNNGTNGAEIILVLQFRANPSLRATLNNPLAGLRATAHVPPDRRHMRREPPALAARLVRRARSAWSGLRGRDALGVA